MIRRNREMTDDLPGEETLDALVKMAALWSPLHVALLMKADIQKGVSRSFWKLKQLLPHRNG
jgi:hypothetical protein